MARFGELGYNEKMMYDMDEHTYMSCANFDGDIEVTEFDLLEVVAVGRKGVVLKCGMTLKVEVDDDHPKLKNALSSSVGSIKDIIVGHQMIDIADAFQRAYEHVQGEVMDRINAVKKVRVEQEGIWSV